jgi:hypothetical protein
MTDKKGFEGVRIDLLAQTTAGRKSSGVSLGLPHPC